jgi:hypothetical protein
VSLQLTVFIRSAHAHDKQKNGDLFSAKPGNSILFFMNVTVLKLTFVWGVWCAVCVCRDLGTGGGWTDEPAKKCDAGKR